MGDVCNMVKIKIEVGKYEFYHFGLGDVTAPCLILNYLIPVCPYVYMFELYAKEMWSYFHF